MFKILVIDDEPIVRNGIVHGIDWAAKNCIIVGEASNGQEGLDAAERYQPDIIITDIRMPQMDGIEMLAELRRRHNKVYVILLTAYSDFEYMRSALKHGAVDYILKPFQPQDLTNAIAQIHQTEAENALPIPQDVLPKVEGQLNKYVLLTMDYIAKNYSDTNVSITSISQHLNISESHLSHLFRQETNYTVIAYLTQYRMHIAMELLKDCRYKISTVAEMVGYRDLAYFGSKFKKSVGMSPSEYQKLF